MMTSILMWIAAVVIMFFALTAVAVGEEPGKRDTPAQGRWFLVSVVFAIFALILAHYA